MPPDLRKASGFPTNSAPLPFHKSGGGATGHQRRLEADLDKLDWVQTPSGLKNRSGLGPPLSTCAYVAGLICSMSRTALGR